VIGIRSSAAAVLLLAAASTEALAVPVWHSYKAGSSEFAQYLSVITYTSLYTAESTVLADNSALERTDVAASSGIHRCLLCYTEALYSY
jgi:hypothetical protein